MRKLLVFALILFFADLMFGQQDPLLQWAKHNRGNSLYRKFGVHNGNRVAVTFRNDGSISGTDPNDIRGAWPYPSTQDSYIGDVTPLVGIQIPIRDYNGDHIPDTLHSVTISPGPRTRQANKVDPVDGHFQGFEPEPGYALQSQDTLAMSHIPTSWPAVWPDHPDWVDPTTGKAVWDGYFGKGVINADQESYFVMDDAQDNSVQRRTNYLFHPDSTDTTRNGMGLVVKVRGLQWSQIQAQDVIFWLYDITNNGTSNYNRVVFGEVVGGCVGNVGQNYCDCKDDLGYFDLNNSLTYTWDSDDQTCDPLWVPISQVLTGVRNAIGFAGYAYLESPGNGYDGIDNDNDEVQPNAVTFQESDFSFNSSYNAYLSTRTLKRTGAGSNANWPDDKIVLIDPGTFSRKVVILDTLLKSNSDTAIVYSMGQKYKIYNGVTLVEIPNNGYDDNLNGLIDENHDLHFQRVFKDRTGIILRTDTRPLAYRNYFTGSGMDNSLIDERRDSGPGNMVSGYVPNYSQPRDPVTGKYTAVIKSHWSGDENGDWNEQYDDVGADGVANTHDIGESDGIPTEGEPHFDRTDINESDQLGLTSFNFFNQSSSPAMDNSEVLWNRMVPGYFDVIPSLPQDGDFIYSSGYFPLLAGKSERFSLAMVFGADSSDIFKNKQVVQQIYDANYNFTKPPDKPALVAVPGNKKVTLIWDNKAESFVDRSIKDPAKQKTFEGYKIYRSTDPGFTEGGGLPIATYDLKDGVYGYFIPKTQTLAALPRYFLGSETGLIHTFVDSSLQNGQGYYYAVTAFTKGDADNSVYPAETPKFITVDNTGKARSDVNTAYAVPQAPVAGYSVDNGGVLMRQEPSVGTGYVVLNIVNPRDLITVNGHTINVTFKDTSYTYKPSGSSNDSTLLNITSSYNVYDATAQDTLVKNNHILTGETDLFNGMRLTFHNDKTALNKSDSSFGWSSKELAAKYSTYTVDEFNLPQFRLQAVQDPSDFQIQFNDKNVDTSISYPIVGFDATPVNFRVKNLTQNKYVKFAFAPILDQTVKPAVQRYLIAIVSGYNGTKPNFSWYLRVDVDSSVALPNNSGDNFNIVTKKPFRKGDVFSYTVKAENTDNVSAKDQLDNIRVVPNPYVAATSQEQPLPPTITSGRGDRKISFIHLPRNSTVYIYTVRGELVQKLEMESGQNLDNGTIDWNLRTRENLEVAYGVYFYVVDAPGVGQKNGKLAIIK